ncbi:MAG: hypothetical protein JWQ04_3531 [Pedosphaera sp.]|nr:hypothetical protein [Pedosphaera sp.]
MRLKSGGYRGLAAAALFRLRFDARFHPATTSPGRVALGLKFRIQRVQGGSRGLPGGSRRILFALSCHAENLPLNLTSANANIAKPSAATVRKWSKRDGRGGEPRIEEKRVISIFAPIFPHAQASSPSTHRTLPASKRNSAEIPAGYAERSTQSWPQNPADNQRQTNPPT